MRCFDSIRPALAEELSGLNSLTAEELVGRFWQRLLEDGAIQGFGGGDRVSKVREWLAMTLDDVLADLGRRGGEIRRLLENEETVNDLEQLTLLVSFLVVMVPVLRDWPIAELLALLVFEIRRRSNERRR
jgi:hypothetical protein